MLILIAEDEPLTARRLQRMVQEILVEKSEFIFSDTVAETIEILDNRHVDLIFLDIHLADGSSLELFSLTEVTIPVIFTTAYDEHAVRAFRLNAIDYLLKPIKKLELEAAMKRWHDARLTKHKVQELSKVVNPDMVPLRFLIRMGQQLHLVNAEEVATFYTEDRIIFLHTFNDRRFPLDQSLDQLEKELDERTFFRINRQVIINREAIEEMHAYSKARVMLKLKPELPFSTIVSTERSPVFKSWLVG